MKFDAEQIDTLNVLTAQQQREQHVTDIKQRWLAAQPGFRPVVARVEDPLLEAWIAACYDDCVALGITAKRIVLRYTFELLRALQLGAGQEFVDGLRDYFCSYRYGSAHALEWIGHVMTTLHAQAHAALATEARAHG